MQIDSMVNCQALLICGYHVRYHVTGDKYAPPTRLLSYFLTVVAKYPTGSNSRKERLIWLMLREITSMTVGKAW